jgi:hypothetical protein
MNFLWNILSVFVFGIFKSEQDLKLEIIVLRQQLIVLERKAPRRLHLTKIDRLTFVWLCRIHPDILQSIRIVKPETVIGWHRRGFKLYWTWKSRPKCPGRPKSTRSCGHWSVRCVVRTPLWGAPRIHGKLMKLGIEVAQSTVSKYMVRASKPPSQTWKTFLQNHADGIAAADFFIVPTINFQLLFVFIVIGHARRRFEHFAVTANPSAQWTGRQIVETLPWDTAPRSPWQNAYAERMIGSIRRECTDHVIVFGRRHLWRILRSYADYYNSSCTHLSLNKNCPNHRWYLSGHGQVVSFPQISGLRHRYERLAA